MLDRITPNPVATISRALALVMAGRRQEASQAFETAARLCSSRPEKTYLRERAEAARRSA